MRYSNNGVASNYSQYKKFRAASTEGEVSMFRELKAYVSEHRDVIFTLGFIFFADSVFLGGALREKLTSIVDKLLKKVGDKLEGSNESTSNA